MKNVLRLSLLFAVVCAALPLQAAGPCICPDIYAPVQCSNGKVYPNQCVANCRHATNCVPTGDIFAAEEQASLEIDCEAPEAGSFEAYLAETENDRSDETIE